MASIRKRGQRWQVQVRRQGNPPQTKTFVDKTDALKWAREQDRSADRQEWLPPQDDNQCLADVLARYQCEVSVTKQSVSDAYHLRQILRHRIAISKLRALTPELVASYRDDRLRHVSAATVRKELSLISHALKIATAEWGLVLPRDPITGVRKPKPERGRNRRLEEAEFERMSQALAGMRNPLLHQVFEFALATAMRRGEILDLVWRNVDLTSRTALLPLTKNGNARLVPLDPSAIKVLKTRSDALCHQTPLDSRVFPISANAVRLGWDRALAKANITNLRFHDLRHEAISRFFEMGLSIPEVSLISGHKEPRMLFRYTHLRPEALAQKLAKIVK